MKILLLLLLILSAGCTSNIVYVEKHVYIFDGENMVEMRGSELKDVTNDQTAKGKFKLPIP